MDTDTKIPFNDIENCTDTNVPGTLAVSVPPPADFEKIVKKLHERVIILCIDNWYEIAPYSTRSKQELKRLWKAVNDLVQTRHKFRTLSGRPDWPEYVTVPRFPPLKDRMLSAPTNYVVWVAAKLLDSGYSSGLTSSSSFMWFHEPQYRDVDPHHPLPPTPTAEMERARSNTPEYADWSDIKIIGRWCWEMLSWHDDTQPPF